MAEREDGRTKGSLIRVYRTDVEGGWAIGIELVTDLGGEHQTAGVQILGTSMEAVNELRRKFEESNGMEPGSSVTFPMLPGHRFDPGELLALQRVEPPKDPRAN